MSPDEIKTDHCYSMAPIKGRRTIARVTKLFRITAMAAYGGTETLELNPIVVRFVWRHAALLPSDFVQLCLRVHR